jgi:hypothetical protein
MNMNILKRTQTGLRAALAIALASISLLSAAQTTQPTWITSSMGSSARVGDTVNLLGGGFTLLSSITIVIVDPAGTRWTKVVGVDGSGTISVPLPLQQSGTYKAEVVNADGQLVASTLVSSAPLPE